MGNFQTITEGKVVLSLTGHRPDKLAGYDLNQDYYHRLRERLIKIIEGCLKQYDIVECHSGMALGADTIWSQAIIHCKEKYGMDKVVFVADIPDTNQPSRWVNQEDKDRWNQIMIYADQVNTYNKNDAKSYGYVLNQRNLGMIKPCDILIAVYDGVSTGGTANAVAYGQEENKYIINIYPSKI